VIPDPDPIGLPAPDWLLIFLLLLTFVLHILAMNLTLGGTVIAVVSDFLGRRRGDERYRRLAQHLVSLLPITLAATITLAWRRCSSCRPSTASFSTHPRY